MIDSITRCDAEVPSGNGRLRSETCSSVESLLSSDSCDRKITSCEETDSGDCFPDPKSDESCTDDIVVLDDERKRKIIQLAEFYLSDTQVLKDVFLLKHVRRNKEGYISLKLLSSFKKMKSATKDWREVALALRESNKLEVNESGSKVRRKDPLPEHDETSPSRVVLAFNLPFDRPSVTDLTDQFSKAGSILSIRVVHPGTVSTEVKKYKIKHKALGSTLCAVIEYDSFKSAAKCAEMMKGVETGIWQNVQVFHNASSDEGSKTDEKSTSPKRKRTKAKSGHPLSSWRSESSNGDYSTSPSLSSSDVEQGNTHLPPPQSSWNRSSKRNSLDSILNEASTGPSPVSRHVKSNSYSDSRHTSFLDSKSGLQKKLNSRFSNLRRHSEGNAPGFTSSKNRRRASSICVPAKSALQVIRNPIGPDGTSGFRNGLAFQQLPVIIAC